MKKLFILFTMMCFAVIAQAQTEKGKQELAKAKSGDTGAQFLVSGYYTDGEEGFPVDNKKGMYWLQKSAEGGDEWSQYFLACYYKDGEYGLRKDVSKFIKWMNIAAENGHPSAYYSLGLYYKDYVKDNSKAIYNFKKQLDYTYNAQSKNDEAAEKELQELGVTYDPATKAAHSLTAANNKTSTAKKTTTSNTTKKKTTTTSNKSKSSAASGQKYHDAAIFDLKGKVKTVKTYRGLSPSSLLSLEFSKDGEWVVGTWNPVRDSDGYVVKAENPLNWGDVSTYKYDSNKRLIEERKNNIETYTRDGNGNVISYKTTGKWGLKHQYTKIKTDSHGNWTERWEDGSTYESREITYWD